MTRPLRRLLSSRIARAVVVASLLPLGASLLSGPASAAETLTPTAPSFSYTAGPFATPNVSANATGEPVCNAALPCNDHPFSVSTPAGYGMDNQLKVVVQWPTAAADFDVYLLDAAGTTISSAASSSDPEVILSAPDTGSYVLRVVPYAPLGQSFTATVSLVAKPVNPPPGTDPKPTFKNYAASESFPEAHSAGEPSIGVDRRTGKVMYQAYTGTARVTFDDTKKPATATWQDASAIPPKCTAATSLDPILFTDRQTGRTFESQLAGKAALTCYTDDDGATWTPTAGSGINSGVDHQTLGGGPFSSGSPGALTGYPNAVYYCSQDIADASCAVSRDGGLTYGPAVPMYSLLDCGGLHGHVKVAPDGTVYVPNKGCGSNQAVAVSEDNGLSWQVRKDPFSTPGDSDPSVGIGSNGTIYMGYQNSDGRPRIAVSRDKGRTWTDDQDVGLPFGIRNSVFPTVVAGDDDRAAFAFLGTPTGGNYQDTANFKGIWHLYVATTYDGGKTWVTVDATPYAPVQRGSICTGGTTCGSDRNLLDFIDVTIDARGRVLVAFADGCTGACEKSGPNNFDALATISRQNSGKTLFAAYDPKPDLIVRNLTASRGPSGAFNGSAAVRNQGGLPAKPVVVRFLDETRTIGETAPIELGAFSARTVSFSGGTVTTGSHTLTAVVDPRNAVVESNESNNRTRRVPFTF
ncbi:MAG: hypothetical protein HYX34_04440 [Actinobacteria bacterium]|nr:hypothetical protein [Actinomycetota bacterium]